MKTTILFLLVCHGLIAQPAFRKFPKVKLADLASATRDTVRIRGYVGDIYVCPPCPPGAQCKPCIENNFMFISQKPGSKPQAGTSVRIFTENPGVFQRGQYCELVVSFRGTVRSPDNLLLISRSNK